MANTKLRNSPGTNDLAPNTPIGMGASGDVVGMPLPIVPTTLPQSQTIPDGYQCVLLSPLTINSGVVLTIEGTGKLIITNPIMAQ